MMAMMEAAERDPSIMATMADPYALNFKLRGLDGPDSNQPFYDNDFGSWVGPFVMGPLNMRVVRRTNELLGGAYGTDFRYDEGSLVKDGPVGMLGATAMALGSTAAMGLATLGPVRSLMQKVLPKPGEGPSDDVIENGFFEIEMLAKHPSDEAKNLRAMVKGDRDPGYGSTSKMLAETAVCLAQDELTVGGGFWTPAAAMGTHLIDRLHNNAGVTFELIN